MTTERVAIRENPDGTVTAIGYDEGSADWSWYCEVAHDPITGITTVVGSGRIIDAAQHMIPYQPQQQREDT